MAENEYLITVIIPNYNYARYLGKAIDSVLGQTFQPLEIIVVDDGSTDDSVSIARKYGGRLKLIQQENQHVSTAGNAGIRAAEGNWIALLDADDIWHPKKLELQVRELGKNPSWSYIAADELPLDIRNFRGFDASIVRSRELSILDFLTVPLMSSSSALIKGSCFGEIGFFDTQLRASEDKDMWWRLAVKFRGGLVEAPLWWYRQHTEQLNRKVDEAFIMDRIALDEFFRQHDDFRRYRRPAIAHYYSSASISHRDNGGRLWKALGYGLVSLLYCPIKYHKDAMSTQERLKSLAATALRILRIKKR